jgi:hypothetical protein
MLTRRFAALTCLAFAGTIPASAQQDDGLHWFDKYADAIQEARRTQKPIFLEYRCEP